MHLGRIATEHGVTRSSIPITCAYDGDVLHLNTDLASFMPFPLLTTRANDRSSRQRNTVVFSPEDTTVCVLPPGGLHQPNGRAFFRPTLQRQSTPDHAHTQGMKTKHVQRWEQWVVDRSGVVDEQGNSVGDRAAFIHSK